jgi:hypothetical protein
MAAFLFIPLASAQAADKGLVINAGKLMAQPFIDAASSGTVKAKQPVTILDRKGGWANVESNGQKGWIRLLNVRLETNTAMASGRPNSGGGGSIFQTGSKGSTATTGIKGMSKLGLQKATPNYVEFDKLANLGVSASEGRSYGARSKLKEQQLQYLKKGSGK